MLDPRGHLWPLLMTKFSRGCVSLRETFHTEFFGTGEFQGLVKGDVNCTQETRQGRRRWGSLALFIETSFFAVHQKNKQYPPPAKNTPPEINSEAKSGGTGEEILSGRNFYPMWTFREQGGPECQWPSRILSLMFPLLPSFDPGSGKPPVQTHQPALCALGPVTEPL